MLSDSSGRPLPLEIGRRNSLTSFNDSRPCDRDYKRRKMDDEPYIVSDARRCPLDRLTSLCRVLPRARLTMTSCLDRHP
jgi:hypothetical protein